MANDRDAELGGDLPGAIGAVRVDHHHLVEQRDAIHERRLQASDDEPDRLLLVERRQPQADRHAQLLLEVDQLRDVPELAGMEGVLREPPIDDVGSERLRST